MKKSKIINPESDQMTNDVLKEMQERIIRSFLDIVLLVNIQKSSDLGGYDIIKLIREKFGIVINPGTIYSFLYSLERDGLLKGEIYERKRIYNVTEKGEEKIEKLLETKQNTLKMISKIY